MNKRVKAKKGAKKRTRKLTKASGLYRVEFDKRGQPIKMEPVKDAEDAAGSSIKIEVDTKQAHEAAQGELATPVAVPTIATLLDQLDLTIDALEGRLARVLRTESDTAAPSVGYSDVARSVHYAIARIAEIAERLDI